MVWTDGRGVSCIFTFTALHPYTSPALLQPRRADPEVEEEEKQEETCPLKTFLKRFVEKYLLPLVCFSQAYFIP